MPNLAGGTDVIGSPKKRRAATDGPEISSKSCANGRCFFALMLQRIC
jgi:hypothetical protein